jgi:hypothetical protein
MNASDLSPSSMCSNRVVYSRRSIPLKESAAGEKFQIESSLLTTRKFAFRLISTGKPLVSRANDLLFKNRNEKLPAGELWASIAEAGQNGKLFQMGMAE